MIRTVLLRGAVAGAVATGAMSILMLGAQRAGLLGGMPPERLTARTLDRAGIRRSRRSQNLLAVLAHFGFGSAGGVLFAGGRSALRHPLPGFLQGAVYGAGVWLVSYAGWIPRLGLMPPPNRDRPIRPQVMLAAHLVYGGILGALSGPIPAR